MCAELPCPLSLEGIYPASPGTGASEAVNSLNFHNNLKQQILLLPPGGKLNSGERAKGTFPGVT